MVSRAKIYRQKKFIEKVLYKQIEQGWLHELIFCTHSQADALQEWQSKWRAEQCGHYADKYITDWETLGKLRKTQV